MSVEVELARRKKRATAFEDRHRKMQGAVIPYASKAELPEIVQEQLAHLIPGSRKPKVCVLYYGGTLGMHWGKNEQGEDVLVPTDDAKELLEPLEKWNLRDRMDVVWFNVLKKAIDSTNARWPHWVTIGNAMKLLYDDFDGFVIAGGTDTLRFMTASQHMQFPNFGKPAIAAAAQREASGWGSDAQENLAFGLIAATADISGAHLAFRGHLRDGRHIFKIQDKRYHAFTSSERYVYGEFFGELELYPNRPRRNPLVTAARLEHDPNFMDGIFSTEIHPFADAEQVLHMSTHPLTQAILFVTYGAGNVRNEPIYEGEMTHVDAIKQLHQRKFPFVLGSPMQDGRIDSHYAVGDAAIKAGAISGGDTTGAMLYVKISRALANSWWTEDRRRAHVRELRNRLAYSRAIVNEDEYYGLDYSEFRRQMYKNHVGELNMEIRDVASR